MATYKVNKDNVAVSGCILADCTQAELKKMFESGDTRFIEKIEEKKAKKTKTKKAEVNDTEAE